MHQLPKSKTRGAIAGFVKRHRWPIIIALLVYAATAIAIGLSLVGVYAICSETSKHDTCVTSWTTPISAWWAAAAVLAGLVINADQMRRNRLHSERELGEAIPEITVMQNAGAQNGHIANIVLTNWNSRPVLINSYVVDGPDVSAGEKIRFRFEKELAHLDGAGGKSGRFPRRPYLLGRVVDEKPSAMTFQLRREDGKSIAGATVTINCEVIGSSAPLPLSENVHETHWSSADAVN
ncbi:hypothetical protein [Rhizobium leguminosarum]|uniref:hypothetical protein n=1 Tax=Rhizobium leguminosarum TaxID=384 RepID=UPI0015B8EC10|nr:hypothetical protein [Rhizobium leguminosarum]